MQQESKVDKFIVFKVENYLLSLRMSEVLKVVDCSSLISKEGLEAMGVVQVGRHMVKVLDLHQQLAPGKYPTPTTDLSKAAAKASFLVITRDFAGELCGISTQEPPNLIDLPLDMMQSLPKSDRQLRGLEMVSHAAVLSDEKGTTTIFLLDMKQAAIGSR